jgi:hypothetical protein
MKTDIKYIRMKQKDYKQKRLDLKDEKRELLKSDFENVKQRKRAVNDIKISFRALKRSEKQIIKQQIKKELE